MFAAALVMAVLSAAPTAADGFIPCDVGRGCGSAVRSPLLGRAKGLHSETAGSARTGRETASTQSSEVVAQIRIQGNTVTSDDDVRRLAGVEVGMSVGPSTVDEAGARLRAANRFERVEVLKRFASIADPNQIAIVIIVDEGPVHIEMTGDPRRPVRVVRSGGANLLFSPILEGEDGYGATYGVRMARLNFTGPRSRLSFPLTWGGDKRAAAELDKTLERGPFDRLLAGASVSRRENLFFEEDADRRRVWVRTERQLARFVRAGATAGWQHVSFLTSKDSFPHAGAELTVDTRLDPMLARNAVYARVAWEHLGLSDRGTNRTELEARGHVGLFGQTILVLRAMREDADRSLPPYLKSLLGGTSTLRGFKAGSEIGDTLVAGSIEVLVPLTSPLSIGKLGVSAFTDVGAVYNQSERLANQALGRGHGGSVWFSAAFVRFSVAVAHGVGASTRVHLGGALSF